MLRNVFEKEKIFMINIIIVYNFYSHLLLPDLASVYLKQSLKTYFEERHGNLLLSLLDARQTSIPSEALRRRGLQLQHTTCLFQTWSVTFLLEDGLEVSLWP